MVERLEFDEFLVQADYQDDLATRETVILNIRAAIDLVASTDLRVLRRMRLDVRRLLIQPAASAAFLSPGTILLPLQSVVNGDTAVLAGNLVHEATHARIAQNGIRYWPDLRLRIERRCLREQVELLTKIPGRSDLVAHYQQYLDEPWWTRNAAVRQQLAFLESSDTPRWIVNLYRFFVMFPSIGASIAFLAVKL